MFLFYAFAPFSPGNVKLPSAKLRKQLGFGAELGQLTVANQPQPTCHRQFTVGQLAMANFLRDNLSQNKSYMNIKEMVEYNHERMPKEGHNELGVTKIKII